MKYHTIKSWEFTDPDGDRQGGLVYTQTIAIDKLADGFNIKLVPQTRACYADTGSDECYMCDQGAPFATPAPSYKDLFVTPEYEDVA